VAAAEAAEVRATQVVVPLAEVLAVEVAAVGRVTEEVDRPTMAAEVVAVR